MRRRILIFLIGTAFAIGGCRSAKDSGASGASSAMNASGPDAPIAQAIQAHLVQRSGLKLDAFDTSLKQVTYNGDHATAQVEFRAKTGGGTMELTYALEKQNGDWHVVESTPNGSNFSHPPLNGSGGTPAMGNGAGGSSVFDTLDKINGATPSSGTGQKLPPGHPVVAPPPKTQP
ncbi:MAG TPA: hypothetical protein VJN93_01325 [Candidatus Acidoferrum sp.]|nr:hypothetical protein [Candidatus Acidoferrum sp.]